MKIFMRMKKKFLKELAKRMSAEDLSYLICRFMLINDTPALTFNYRGRGRIDGAIIKGSRDEASFNIPYAGDENT